MCVQPSRASAHFEPARLWAAKSAARLFRIDSAAAFKVQIKAIADTAPLVPVDLSHAPARLREVAACSASNDMPCTVISRS